MCTAMSDWRQDGDAYFPGLALQSWKRDSFSLGKKQSSCVTQLCTYQVNNTTSEMKLVRHSPSKFQRIFTSFPFSEGKGGQGELKREMFCYELSEHFTFYDTNTASRSECHQALSEWCQNLVPISEEIEGSLKSACSFIYSGVVDVLLEHPEPNAYPSRTEKSHRIQ